MIWVSLLLLSPPPPALATPAAQTSRFSRYSLPSLPLVRRPKSELAIRSSAGTLHPQAWSTGCGGLRRGVMRGAASGGGRRFVAPTGQEGQTISAGDNIVVMGALDQVGRTIIGRLQKEGDFKISTLLSPNVLGMFKSKYPTIEAISASDEQEAKATLQKASVVIMAFEKPADTDTLRYLLGFGAEGEAKLKRFVLLSKTGVTRKNNIGMAFFKNVIGGELNKYFDLEDLLLKGADALKVDYTIVRSGKLRLGPDDFMNPDALSAAEDNLFQTRMGKIEFLSDDSKDGESNRYDVADAIIESLLRPSAANKIFSVINVEGKDKDMDTLFNSI